MLEHEAINIVWVFLIEFLMWVKCSQQQVKALMKMLENSPTDIQ